MVGHSQGGMMPRYYLKFLGGASKVDDLVGLSPSNHGTSNPLLLTPGLNLLCPSCLQQRTGSAFLRRLNAGDETPGAVSYTNIVTAYDEVVLPYSSGYLSGPRTTNIKLQSKCPYDVTGHLLIPSNGPAIRLVLNALGRRGPANPTYQPPACPDRSSQDGPSVPDQVVVAVVDLIATRLVERPRRVVVGDHL